MTLEHGKMKAGMSRSSNIMDKIQKGLDQKVFSGITPRPRVPKFIEEEMRKVLTPKLGFDPLEFMDLYLTGSLTTYQYSDTSDCDVSVFIDWDHWPTGEAPNIIRKKVIPVVMNELDGTNLPGTEHPIQHFVVPPGVKPSDLYKPGLRSAWSFRDKKWLVPPEKDRVHDISTELPVMWHRAKLMEDKMNVLLETNPIYAKEFWHQIHRKRQQDQKAGLGDFSEGNIVYKLLLHDGYFDRIRDELGEKISKTAWDENFSVEDYDLYVPPVGSIWTIADPWSKTRNPPGPDHQTVQIQSVESRYIWYKDLDTQTGKDQADAMSIRSWNDKMSRGLIRQKAQDWTFQESPEEAAGHWPDTIPDKWTKVAWPWDSQPEAPSTSEWDVGLSNEIPEGTNVHDPNLCPSCGRQKNPNSDFCPYCYRPYDQPPDPEVQKAFGWHPSQYPDHIPQAWVNSMKQPREKGNPHPPYPKPPIDQLASPQMVEWMRGQIQPRYQDYLDGWLAEDRISPKGQMRTHDWVNGLNKLKDYAFDYGTGYNLVRRQPPPPPNVFNSKTADDLSWVDKSTPYGTPDGGFIGGPEHWGDDSIDLPSEPHRDLTPPDNMSEQDPKGSLKVIYDFERDQIILGDVRKADQFPAGQIIGDYRDGDVYLNDHAEAWFNAKYFKRLWQHSFPKRPIRHVILDKGDGQHEVVHRHPTSAILPEHEAHEEDQAGLEDRRQDDDQAQPQSSEPLQVTSVEEYGEYYWPEPEEIMQAGVDAVEATGQPHPGFRQGAEAAIDSARGAAINRHLGMFGMGGSNDPYDLAGHLIWRIQATQMAVDGNKRMAATTGLSWLSMHGFDVSKLPQDDTFFKVVEQAATMDETQGPELIAEFLRQYVPEETDA